MLTKLSRNDTPRRGRYADYEFGAVASAMGLTVVSGDPGVNLVLDLPDRFSDVAGGNLAALSKGRRLDLRATGDAYGRSVELAWSDAAGKRRGVLSSTVTYSFNGHLSVSVRSAMEPFEVTNRDRSLSGFDPRPVFDGPELPLGIPDADEAYRLTSGSPLEPELAELVADLAVHDWVHLVWDGQTISHRLQPYCGAMFTDAAAVLDSLSAMAAILEQEHPHV